MQGDVSRSNKQGGSDTMGLPPCFIVMRKQIWILITILCIIIVVPIRARAHLAGQPPFFKINSTYSGYYPVPISSVPDLAMPQDIAPANYLVNESIDFEIDAKALGVPQAVVDKSVFSWEYGDGQKATGLKNSHSYTKMGSYVLLIYVSYTDLPAPQLLQTVLLNILPDKNYQLPQAIIKVNNQRVKDPIVDTLEFSFKKPLTFDAQTSEPQSQIISYFWDFGDAKSSTEVVVDHKYSEALGGIVYPVLRIKDRNGFQSDAFVQINRNENTQVNKSGTKSTNRISLIIASVCFILIGLFILWRLLKSRNQES